MPSPTDVAIPPMLVMAPDEPLAPQIAAQVTALFPGQALVRSDDPDAAIGSGDACAIIVAVTHPVEAIARHLSDTGTVEQALSAWKAQAQPLLRAVRRVRRRLRLVDARDLACGAPQVLCELSSAGGPLSAKDIPPPPDPVLLVIAEAALRRDPEALRLADEIAALRRGGDGSGLSAGDCQAALDRLRQDLAGLEAKANLLEAEVSLLRESLALRLGADRSAAAEPAQKRLAALAAGARPPQDVLADLTLQTAKVQALQRQLDIATEQAAGREAVLAAILLKDQQDLMAGAESKARVEQLEQELHSVYTSKSWRVTSPLRALRSKG